MDKIHEAMNFKTLNIQQQGAVNKLDEPYNCPMYWLKESFQILAQARGSEVEPSGLSELRKRNKLSRETKAIRITQGRV